MRVLRFLMRLVVGAVFALICTITLSPAFAAMMPGEEGGEATAGIMAIVFIAITALCAFAPSMRRAFGRGCLITGAAMFLLPLSTMLLSGVTANEVVEAAAEADRGAAVIGTGLATGAFTLAAGFIGFILGSIFLIAGLILSLGGRREVVVYEDRSRAKPQTTVDARPSMRADPTALNARVR